MVSLEVDSCTGAPPPRLTLGQASIARSVRAVKGGRDCTTLARISYPSPLRATPFRLRFLRVKSLLCPRWLALSALRHALPDALVGNDEAEVVHLQLCGEAGDDAFVAI